MGKRGNFLPNLNIQEASHIFGKEAPYPKAINAPKVSA